MVRKKLKPVMLEVGTNEATDDFSRQINIALLFLRVQVGRSGICPVCFCNAIQRILEEVKNEYHHNEMALPLSDEQVREASFELGLSSEMELLLMTPPEEGITQ